MKKPTYVEGYDLTLRYCQWAAIADMLEREHQEISQYIWDEIAIYTQQIKGEPLAGITIYGVSPDDLAAIYTQLEHLRKQLILQVR